MSRKHKKLLFQNTERVTKGVIYGQILTAIIQGGIAGIGFIIFGVSNPIFWGFIMMILAFIPVVGAWLIWWPAVAISIAQGNYVTGIGLAVYGLIIVSNVDNLVRPKLVGDRAKLHPALVLIGVLGGLKLFGFIGMLIGPVFFSILFVFFKVYMEISDKKSKA